MISVHEDAEAQVARLDQILTDPAPTQQGDRVWIYEDDSVQVFHHS